MTRQKCELRVGSRPLVPLWRWTLPVIFVIFVTLLAARASLPDPSYDNGVRYYPGTLHALFPSFILLEIFTLLVGLAAIPFCLKAVKAVSWHMLSIAGFLIFNWLQGLLVAWLLSMRQRRLWEERLGETQWGIKNFVAAARAWMIGIEILWIQCLGLHKVWILEVASGRRSGRMKILSGLIRLLGVFLVFLVPAIVTWRIVGEDNYDEALRRLGLPSEAVLYPPIFVAAATLVMFQVILLSSFCSARKQLAKACPNSDQACTAACRSAFQNAQRSIFRQFVGLMFAIVTTDILAPLGLGIVHFTTRMQHHPFQDLIFYCGVAIQIVNLLANVCGAWVLSNAYQATSFLGHAQYCSAHAAVEVPRMEDAWMEKVEELSSRGISAEALLYFYKGLPSLMPSYDPCVHTTCDVVRQAIIPATREQRSSYSALLGAARPDKMVTHSWQNLFHDLVAAVIADAVNEPSFELVADILTDNVQILEDLLQLQGTGTQVYWICAFSVNQHLGICGGNPNGDCDSVTKIPYDLCDCNLPKHFNSTMPTASDGRSIGCEMNKFDDMMALLAARNPNFSQVVAVDSQCGLFRRAWCVAELVQASQMQLVQHVKIRSKAVLQEHVASLQDLRVENMKASRPEDVQEILSKIPDTEAFNQSLQKLILDKESGILSDWHQLDSAHQMQETGALLKWAAADNGTGVVWKFWAR